jgi:hypothetical protein
MEAVFGGSFQSGWRRVPRAILIWRPVSEA